MGGRVLLELDVDELLLPGLELDGMLLEVDELGGELLLELDELGRVLLELDVEELLLLELELGDGNVANSTQLPMYGPGSSVPVSGSATIAADT